LIQGAKGVRARSFDSHRTASEFRFHLC
jgi:hypothetical protein